jgi:hypothetical protein
MEHTEMPRVLAVVLAIVLSASAFIYAGFAQAQSSTQQPAVTPAPTTTTTPEELEAEAKRMAEQRESIMLNSAKLRRRIKRYRETAWYWQDVMQAPRRRTPFFARASRHNVPKLQRLEGIWKNRAHHAKYRAHRPPMLWAWLCIHRHEAPSWGSNSNPKYKGGLQFDRLFELMYNYKLAISKGRANNWSKWEQIWTAVRAWRSRYFRPWPNTRKPCHV